ncbi:MAG: hypothetical protein WC701_13860, partial [Kiritimatiellales bacterium]
FSINIVFLSKKQGASRFIRDINGCVPLSNGRKYTGGVEKQKTQPWLQFLYPFPAGIGQVTARLY